MTRRLALRVLLLAALAGGCASEPTATWREVLQTTDVGDTRTSALTTLLELGAQQALGPDLEYRVSERIIDTRLQTEVDGVDTQEDRLLHQPSLDVVIRTPTLTWTQGLELLQQRSSPSPGANNTRERTDVLEKVEWSPIGLPRLTAWIDWRRDQDDLFVDQDDTEMVLQLDDEVGPFTWFYAYETEAQRDHSADVDRDRDEHEARASYREEHLEGRLTTSASVALQRRDLEVHTPSGSEGALPPVEIFPVQGLSALDTTPALGALADTPALIDGDDTTAAGINIGGFGSGGEPDWNIGVRVPNGSTVDLAVVSTAVEVDPLFVDQYAWSVWSSTDNAFWTQVTSSAAFSYEAAFRRFRISFPDVATQYLKVVATAVPPTAPAVFVTEMRTFEPGDPVPGDVTSRQHDRDDSVTASTSWRATDTLLLGADVLAQEVERETSGTTTRDESRLDTGVNALWTPNPITDVSVRANRQDTEDEFTADETLDLLTALLTLRPLERLDLGLNWTTTDRESSDGSSDLSTDSLQARVAAELLPTLQAQVTAETATEDDETNAREVDRTIFTGSLTAEVTPDWDVTLSLRDEQADVTGAGAADVPDPSNTSHQVVVIYQPGDQLTVEVDLEWLDTFAGSGLDQQLRFDWLPFRDGSLDLQIDLQRIEDGTFDETTDRYLFLTRWTMNPRAYLELNWSVQEPENADKATLLTLSLNVEW